MPETVLIFANPIAGRGLGKLNAMRVAARLKLEGFDARLVLERVDRVPREHLVEAAHAAVAIGGD